MGPRIRYRGRGLLGGGGLAWHWRSRCQGAGSACGVGRPLAPLGRTPRGFFLLFPGPSRFLLAFVESVVTTAAIHLFELLRAVCNRP